jgi:hypothetical protein
MEGIASVADAFVVLRAFAMGCFAAPVPTLPTAIGTGCLVGAGSRFEFRMFWDWNFFRHDCRCYNGKGNSNGDRLGPKWWSDLEVEPECVWMFFRHQRRATRQHGRNC